MGKYRGQSVSVYKTFAEPLSWSNAINRVQSNKRLNDNTFAWKTINYNQICRLACNQFALRLSTHTQRSQKINEINETSTEYPLSSNSFAIRSEWNGHFFCRVFRFHSWPHGNMALSIHSWLIFRTTYSIKLPFTPTLNCNGTLMLSLRRIEYPYTIISSPSKLRKYFSFFFFHKQTRYD